jgi:hypothetical protein
MRMRWLLLLTCWFPLTVVAATPRVPAAPTSHDCVHTGDDDHQALNRIATLRPLALPYTGSATPPRGHSLPALAGLGVALFALGGALRARRANVRPGPRLGRS